MSDVNTICDRIHSLVQMSGLHFNITQTPWSSYITFRRKFVSPDYKVNTKSTENVVVDQLKEIKKTEVKNHKMAEVGIELVELDEETFANEIEEYQKTITLLNSQIYTLKKDKDLKDEIIQNINAHFNTKVSELYTQVEELVALKKKKRASRTTGAKGNNFFVSNCKIR